MPFPEVGVWNGDSRHRREHDELSPNGQALPEWLVNVGASPTLNSIALENLAEPPVPPPVVIPRWRPTLNESHDSKYCPIPVQRIRLVIGRDALAFKRPLGVTRCSRLSPPCSGRQREDAARLDEIDGQASRDFVASCV
jgi:hypothetical protein